MSDRAALWARRTDCTFSSVTTAMINPMIPTIALPNFFRQRPNMPM
jgi:hypothetical protein